VVSLLTQQREPFSKKSDLSVRVSVPAANGGQSRLRLTRSIARLLGPNAVRRE
jgi:hypothetical protein